MTGPIRDHHTLVKFTGSGHRAMCLEPGCRFYGQTHSMMRLMAMGLGTAAAHHKTKMLAEQDAQRHVREERQREITRRHRARGTESGSE